MEASLKKKILIAIAATAGLLLLLALGWYVYFKGQFGTYQDDQYRFSIKYPSSWRTLPHPKPTVAVIFVRPKDTALDPIQENFNVTIQPMPTDISTLAAFSATIKNQMTAVFGKNLNIVEDKDIQWGWRQGHEMVFEASDPDHLVMVTAWTLRDDEACILTFLGDLNRYAQDAPVVDEIVRSLQLQ